MNTTQALNLIAFQNTIEEIVMKINVARSPVKSIAEDAAYFAKQIKGERFARSLNAIAACKTRKAMMAVISGITF